MDELDIKILQELLNYDYISSTQLAEALHVSERTIRKRTKDMEEDLEGSRFVSSPGLGIKLEVIDPLVFNSFLKEAIAKNGAFPTTKQGRIAFIIDYLLLSDEHVNLSVLSEQLFISRSTLSTDLVSVRKYFSDYQIEVVDYKKKGVRLEGSETNIRKCLSHISANLNRFNIDALGGHEQYESVSNLLKRELEINDFVLSDIGFQNLCNHLYILVERIKNENTTNTEEMEALGVNLSNLPLEVAQNIASSFSKEFEIEFPNEEIIYIAIHLAGKQNMYLSKSSTSIHGDDDVIGLVKEILESIHSLWNIDLRNDNELFFNLVLHFKPLLIRVESGFEQKNPMLDSIKQNLSLAYLLSAQSTSILEKRINKSISADEVGFVALHINLALARKRDGTVRKNLIIVCSTGRGSSELLSYRIKDTFFKYLNIVETSDLNGLSNLNLSNFDLIISTVTLDLELSIPVIQVDYFLNDNDMHKIEEALSSTPRLRVSSYFTRNLFMKLENYTCRESILRAMVDNIKEEQIIPDNFLDLVLKREDLGSTDYGNLIALPHPNEVVSDNTFVAIAILDRPVLWERAEVQVIILVSIQKNFNGDLEYFYRVMSEFMASGEYVKELIHDQDFDKFMLQINKIDEQKQTGGTYD